MDKNAINERLNNPPRGENVVRLNVKWARGTKGHARQPVNNEDEKVSK